MTPIHTRFSPLQRALHWIMAICILAMSCVDSEVMSSLIFK